MAGFFRAWLGLLLLAPAAYAAGDDGSDNGYSYQSSGADPGPGPGSTVSADGPMDVSSDGFNTTYSGLDGVTIEFDDPASEAAQSNSYNGGVAQGDPPAAPSDPSPPLVDPAPLPSPDSAPVNPPTAAIAATPANGTLPFSTTLTWSTTGADAATVAGAGLASGDLSGAQGVTLSSPGSYTYTITASGAGGQTTQSATISVAAPQYTLTTSAVGDGRVTPGGTYPANTVVALTASPGDDARFTGWTGGATAGDNPLSITLSGDTVLYANFASRLAQTIAFSPPANVKYPGPGLGLAATATSGLPVSFSVVSGPATLDGSQLTVNGAGAVTVQAAQAGDGTWLPAPPVRGTLNGQPAPALTRIRFNATGNDARVVNQSAPIGSSFIWTDPAGLLASPWPSFATPAAAPSGAANFNLPAPPAPPPAN